MNYEQYYQHLLHRSKLSLVYRKFYLYPRLSRWLAGKVLDFGCGIGDFLDFRPNTIGVDINPYVIRHCQQHDLKAYLIEKLPLDFQNDTFQGVLLDNVLEHLDTPAPVMDEIKRLITISGTMIVGVPGKKGFTCDSDHKRFYDEFALKDLITSYGFEWHRTLHMPLRFPKVSQKLSQYCIYGIFQNMSL